MTEYCNFRYIKESKERTETVEFDIHENGQYITTCFVAVRYILQHRVTTHPCKNCDNLKLSDRAVVEVLKVAKKARDAVKYSGKQKTLDEWGNSYMNLDEYLAIGDKVDEALVDMQMNCVPPRSLSYGYLQVGEPYADALDERNNKGCYRATYTTFHKKSDKDYQGWVYAGHCFAGENINRLPEKDVVRSMLREFEAKLANFEVWGGDNHGA